MQHQTAAHTCQSSWQDWNALKPSVITWEAWGKAAEAQEAGATVVVAVGKVGEGWEVVAVGMVAEAQEAGARAAVAVGKAAED